LLWAAGSRTSDGIKEGGGGINVDANNNNEREDGADMPARIRLMPSTAVVSQIDLRVGGGSEEGQRRVVQQVGCALGSGYSTRDGGWEGSFQSQLLNMDGYRRMANGIMGNGVWRMG
jgi:hypothetical protein